MRRLFAMILSCTLLLSSCGADPGLSADQPQATILSLGVWFNGPEIQTLVERFNAAQTDYQIQVEAYYDENTGPEAALDRMNAQITTGDTPDILYLNSMDVASLKNAGVLRDLTPLMEGDPDFHEEDYFMNIWELFREEGKLYEFVPCFEIGGICGPASLLGDRTGWTIPEYQDFAARWKLDRPMLEAGRDQMLTYMIQFSTEAYLDASGGKSGFDCAGFEQWLEFVKAFPEGIPQDAVMWAGWVNSFAHLVQLESEEGIPMRIVGFPEDRGGGPCAMSLSSFGISAATEYPEICWEFLMMTLEESYQTEILNGMMLGFPMRRSSLDELIREATAPDSKVECAEVQALSEETGAYILECIGSIDRLRLRHQPILDIISEEVQDYFQDNTSAAHCAEMVQARVMTYLAEQK